MSKYIQRKKYAGGGTANIVLGGALTLGGAALTAGTFGAGAGLGAPMMASGVGMMAGGISQNKAEKDAAALAAKQAAENDIEMEKQKRLANFQTGNKDLTMRWNNTPTFAKGGRLNSTMNNGEPIEVTQFNGNRHEQGGIPLGANAEVEGGETRVEDYIFSDRINLPGSAKTFAQESKRIERMYSQRKHDPYTRISKERDLTKLQNLQEQIKAEQFQQELAGLAQENPEQFQQFTQGIAQQGQEMQGQPQISPEEMQMMQQQQSAPQMRYGGTFYGCGGRMKAMGGEFREPIMDTPITMAMLEKNSIASKWKKGNGGSMPDPKRPQLFPRTSATNTLPQSNTSVLAPTTGVKSMYVGDPKHPGNYSTPGLSSTEYPEKEVVPTPEYLKDLAAYEKTMASLRDRKLTEAQKQATINGMLKSTYFNNVASNPKMFAAANGPNTSLEYYPLERVGAEAATYGSGAEYTNYLNSYTGEAPKGYTVNTKGISKPSYMMPGTTYTGAYQPIVDTPTPAPAPVIKKSPLKPTRTLVGDRWESTLNGEVIQTYPATKAEIKKNTNAYGGSIHIKPENRGKFNATKERTGKTTEELTHSKNPVTRKRAIFAQNARRWKHAEGGFLDTKIVNGQKMYLIEE